MGTLKVLVDPKWGSSSHPLAVFLPQGRGWKLLLISCC